MTPADLEIVLKDLSRYGTRVKDYAYRKVWRVQRGEDVFYLKFYPHRQNFWKRLLRGSPAMREFIRLQMLQKAQTPSARAMSVLMGYTIEGERGDALLIEAIEPSVSLLDLAQQAELSGRDIPEHRLIVQKMLDLLHTMGRANLGHSDLHLGNFLWKDGQVYLIDAYPLHRRGLTLKDVMGLANSAIGIATRSDLLRAWKELGSGGPMPAYRGPARSVYRKLMSRIYGDNRYFASIRQGAWRGAAFLQFPRPRRWARCSQMVFEKTQWEQAWPQLQAVIENDQLRVLKRSGSGDVLEGEIVIAGRPIEIVVKRPRRRYWYRYINELGRGSRAKRAWWKSWRNIHRGIPCAWPLLLMEKRHFGYVTDAVMVFEKVRGQSLSGADLNALSESDRQTMFHRVGALLRKMESVGLYHWDAKASNWIVQLDDPTGPFPLLVDVDGIRNHWGIGEGMRRLLLSMRQHPQYTPVDSLNLCRGYAPFAPIELPEASIDASDPRSDEDEQKE